MIRRTEVRLGCLLCGALLLAGTASRGGAQTPADSAATAADSAGASAGSGSAPADSSSASADTTATEPPPQPFSPLSPGFAVPPADTAAADTAAPVEAVPDSPPLPPGRPRVGLVLSGGGARGPAHVRLLPVLQGDRIAIDCIARTRLWAVICG